MIYLRPHHILCLKQFKGYGYNNEFVKNMFNILDKLEKEQIIVKINFDDICKKCPNLINDKCISDSDIHLLDDKVLKLLNIQLNKPMYFNDIYLHISKYLTENTFYEICSSCSWFKKGTCEYKNFNIKIKED